MSGALQQLERQKSGKSVRVTDFVIRESYAGKMQLKDIFADLLYSEYCRKNNQKRQA